MKSYPSSQRSHQGGVVLLFCLIILVVLLAGGVAVMRSMNTSLFGAGNLAFKRDLVNQGEQAASTALALFRTGPLATVGADATSLPASNYSAIRLDTNSRGVPLALLDENTTAATTHITQGDTKIYYLIERLCNATGPASKSNCIYAPAKTEVRGGDGMGADRPPPASALVYRLTVRVDGPRNTQAFLQSSFTKPE